MSVFSRVRRALGGARRAFVGPALACALLAGCTAIYDDSPDECRSDFDCEGLVCRRQGDVWRCVGGRPTLEGLADATVGGQDGGPVDDGAIDPVRRVDADPPDGAPEIDPLDPDFGPEDADVGPPDPDFGPPEPDLGPLDPDAGLPVLDDCFPEEEGRLLSLDDGTAQPVTGLIPRAWCTERLVAWTEGPELRAPRVNFQTSLMRAPAVRELEQGDTVASVADTEVFFERVDRSGLRHIYRLSLVDEAPPAPLLETDAHQRQFVSREGVMAWVEDSQRVRFHQPGMGSWRCAADHPDDVDWGVALGADFFAWARLTVDQRERLMVCSSWDWAAGEDPCTCPLRVVELGLPGREASEIIVGTPLHVDGRRIFWLRGNPEDSVKYYDVDAGGRSRLLPLDELEPAAGERRRRLTDLVVDDNVLVVEQGGLGRATLFVYRFDTPRARVPVFDASFAGDVRNPTLARGYLLWAVQPDEPESGWELRYRRVRR